MGWAAQAEALASPGREVVGRGGEGGDMATARVQDWAAGTEEEARAPAGDRHGFSLFPVEFWFVEIGSGDGKVGRRGQHPR